MTNDPTPPQARTFLALELALEIIASLRGPVAKIRRRSPKLARQIEDAANSVVANLGEGSRRRGKDRIHFYSIAEGSADEIRCHLRAALAWDWVTANDVRASLSLIDRELAIVWRLTH